jgi:hypothetical protein
MSISLNRNKEFETLSKILKINTYNNSSSSPDIELIRKLKEKIDVDNSKENLQLIDNPSLLIDNPLLRLSMKDFENICKDKDIDTKALFNMLVIISKTNEKKLTKICKNINIFKDNFDSSPESIKNKMKLQKAALLELPDDMREEVFDIFKKILTVELCDWIPIHKLNWDKLSLNPNAIHLLEDELKNNPINNKINWDNLALNPNALHLLNNNPDKINWKIVSTTENGIKLIRKYIYDGKNSKTYKQFIKVLNWYFLSRHEKAIDILEKSENYDYICWYCLSKNPKATKRLKDRWELEKRIKKHDPIQYNILLEDEENMVNWSFISRYATDLSLLREKIIEENNLSISELKYLKA